MRMRKDSVRSRVSYDNYADLETVCENLADKFVSNTSAIEIINMLMKRINTKRIKNGRRNITTPRIKFYSNQDGGCYQPSNHQMRISNNPSIYLIVHELAHCLHYHNGLIWQIKRKESDGRFDWHGVRFVGYMTVLRDIIEGQKAFEKYVNPAEYKAKRAVKLAAKPPQKIVSPDQIKLDLALKNQKAWVTKQKRAETALKKYNRRIKYYTNRIAKV